jgi:hypothetical protein
MQNHPAQGSISENETQRNLGTSSDPEKSNKFSNFMP